MKKMNGEAEAKMDALAKADSGGRVAAKDN